MEPTEVVTVDRELLESLMDMAAYACHYLIRDYKPGTNPEQTARVLLGIIKYDFGEITGIDPCLNCGSTDKRTSPLHAARCKDVTT